MNNTWANKLHTQGFLAEEVSRGIFSLKDESSENTLFLQKVLERLHVSVKWGADDVTIAGECTMEQWLKAVDVNERGRTERVKADFQSERPNLRELDVYMSGLIVELNKKGIVTTDCCDGHGKHRPHIRFATELDAARALFFLKPFGAKIPSFVGKNLIFPVQARAQLPEAALLIRNWETGQEGTPAELLMRNRLEAELDACLAISGESGREQAIRDYVTGRLRLLADAVTTDDAGNVYAYVSGERTGPVTLLNAHLDTVVAFDDEREVVKDGAIWSSTSGILGADDRAGVAAILTILSLLDRAVLRGTVKVIFTVEEEIGLCGAKEVPAVYLQDVQSAFVLDRRGSGDIVTSCRGVDSFCTPSFGAAIETRLAEEGISGWKVTPGGYSDTAVWARHGINSVNLSAGYQNEHTSYETLDVNALAGTVRVVQCLLEKPVAARLAVKGLRRSV